MFNGLTAKIFDFHFTWRWREILFVIVIVQAMCIQFKFISEIKEKTNDFINKYWSKNYSTIQASQTLKNEHLLLSILIIYPTRDATKLFPILDLPPNKRLAAVPGRRTSYWEKQLSMISCTEQPRISLLTRP